MAANTTYPPTFNPWTDLPWQQRTKIPVVPPPPGLSSNFVDPPNLHHLGIITQTICLSLATILILLRVYTKCTVLRNFGWDDWTSILSWMGFIVTVVLCFLEDRSGLGLHLWDIIGDDFTHWLRLAYVHQILYNPIIFVTKLSILLLYMRIFEPARGAFITFHVLLWTNALIYTVGSFVVIFQCTPIKKAWYVLAEGQCIDQRIAKVAFSVINCVSDFTLFLLPIRTVWTLQKAKGKPELVAIFAFGFVGNVASIARLILIIKVSSNDDASWRLYGLNLWSSAEIACGIICGCLPCLPAFIRHASSGFSHQKDIRGAARVNRNSTYAICSNCGHRQPSKLTNPSAGSSGTTKNKSRRELWEDMDDLEYQNGDEIRSFNRDKWERERRGKFENMARDDNRDWG